MSYEGKYVYGATQPTIRTYIKITTDNANYSKSQYKVTIYYGFFATAPHYHYASLDTVTVSGTGYATQEFKPTSHHNAQMSTGDWFNYGSKTFYFPKKENGYTATVSVKISIPSIAFKPKEVSTATFSVKVPELESYTVTPYLNGGSPMGGGTSMAEVISSSILTLTKYYGKTLKIWATKPIRTNYTFLGWKDSDGTTYQPSGNYTKNKSTTLTAQWSYDNPPSIKTVPQKITLEVANNGGKAVKGFSSASVNISGATCYTGREISSIKLTVGSQTATISGADLVDGSGTVTIPTLNTSGTFYPNVVITDSAGKTQTYALDRIDVVEPKWENEVLIKALPPAISTSGKPFVGTIQIYNYHASQVAGYDVWDTAAAPSKARDNKDGTWSFYYTFDEHHVSDPSSANPDYNVRILYTHYNLNEREYRRAFFSTTRNCNFSNGIYNTMFLGGVEASDYPNYTSRVWWCAVNNPLYFPDTNYIEVGSNDTSVKGLAKVGNYLGAIKQSKTTDTAIYLIYPTSFDEQTTYAVKQGVQGVGALGKYTFNILGDETLFLSPNGVMAITPSEDEDHKVQNRSYYVDGKLLKEENLPNAYSFVYDGKYYLGVLNDEAHCYVLDGNQRNSWGNDRTNLVYECYYLDNVPAKCFVKYHDDLMFSTGTQICRFKRRNEENAFIDDYDVNAETSYNQVEVAWYDPIEIVTEDEFNEDKTHYYTENDGVYTQCTSDSVWDADTQYYEYVNIFIDDPSHYFTMGDNGDYIRCTSDAIYDSNTTYYEQMDDDTPVKAEWSTLLDDDGALNYYKTMQKKGNIVSVLPIENEVGFEEVEITELQFNANKKKYFALINGKYVKSRKKDTFDPSLTYFVERHSSTKVYIRKDNDDEIEIQRTFSRSSKIPSEMVLRKKCKKYKRLQFILRNEEAEDFGIDQIVKSYLIKSYAKK